MAADEDPMDSVFEVNADVVRFCLSAFYNTFDDDASRVEEIAAKIMEKEDVRRALLMTLRTLCEKPVYKERGARFGDWCDGAYSVTAVEYRFKNFFGVYDPDHLDEKVDKVMEDILDNEDSSMNLVVKKLCEEYPAAKFEDWAPDFPPALRNGPFVDRTGAISSPPSYEEDIKAKTEWLASFFDTFNPADTHRVADLAKADLPTLPTLARLYKEYSVPPYEAWEFEKDLRFSREEILADTQHRVEEFFTDYVKGGTPDEVEGCVNYANEGLFDKDLWPVLYGKHGVDLKKVWPASRLPGAPLPKAPQDYKVPSSKHSSSSKSSSKKSSSSARSISGEHVPQLQPKEGSQKGSQDQPHPPPRKGSVHEPQQGPPPSQSRTGSLAEIPINPHMAAQPLPPPQPQSRKSSIHEAAAEPASMPPSQPQSRRSSIHEAAAELINSHMPAHPLPPSLPQSRRSSIHEVEPANPHVAANPLPPSLPQSRRSSIHEVEPANPHVAAHPLPPSQPHSRKSSFASIPPSVHSMQEEVRSKRMLCIPGVFGFRSLDLGGVPQGSKERLEAAARWDISKAFSHDDVVVDSMKGTVIEYHLVCPEDTAKHVHASANDAVMRMGITFPSLSQEYKAVTGTEPCMHIDYVKTAVVPPMTLEAHAEDRKKSAKEQLREKLAFFHVKHAPSDLANVETLLAQSQLDETHLFKALYLRYNLGPYDGLYDSNTWRSTPVTSAVINDDTRLRKRLTDFYMLHNPAELYKVELAMQAGLSEDVLFTRLHKRYGLPAPSPASDIETRAGTPSPPRHDRHSVQHDEIAKKERSLVEDAANLEARERLLVERERGTDRASDERSQAAQIREDALRDWERQLHAREDGVRHREQTVMQREMQAEHNKLSSNTVDVNREMLVNSELAAFRERETRLEERETRLHQRWKEVAEKEIHAAEKDVVLRAQQDSLEREQRNLRQSRSLSPTIERTKHYEQEEKLRQLSERLDKQLKQVSEKEEQLRVREYAIVEKESSAYTVPSPGRAATDSVIAEQLRNLETRERAIAAKEIEVMTSALRTNNDKAKEDMLNAREKLLNDRHEELAKKEHELEHAALVHQDDIKLQESRLQERTIRLEAREQDLIEQTAAADARERRMLFAEQSAATSLKTRELEERRRELGMKEQLINERDASLRQREQQTNDVEVRAAAELGSLAEKERHVAMGEEDLRRRAMECEMREREMAAVREELDLGLRRVEERTRELHLREEQVAEGLNDLTKKETGCRTNVEEVRRLEGRLREVQEETEMRQRELGTGEKEVRGREEKVMMQEAMLQEQEKIWRRKLEQVEKKQQYMDELEVSLKHKEGLVSQTLKEIERKDEKEDRLNTRLTSLREREDRLLEREARVYQPAQPRVRVSPTRQPPPHRPSNAYTSSIQQDLDSIRESLASLTPRDPPFGLVSPRLRY